ncbi:acyltransferase domain-containing protein, partial [Streptomyces samsunensis]|uniref:acyltransferase domain-containing protein n=1 Tax=Streptomyces malaysiensis TaxID=92644 RepID=UPI00158355BE
MPVIPAGVNFDTPLSGIPLEGLYLQVVTGCGSWRGGRRVAGVGSFGLGGADCHVVVAARFPDGFAALASPGRAAVSGRAAVCGAVPVVVSGRIPAAVRAQAARLADWVDGHPGSGLVDLGGSLLSSCTFFDRRVVSLGVDGLRVLAAGGVGGNVVIGRVAVVVGRMVFVFPGRGSQWVGMARELMGGSLVFAARMGECGQVLELFTGWRLADVLGDADALERTEVVQPVVWAVMVSLAAMWQSLGVVPG